MIGLTTVSGRRCRGFVAPPRGVAGWPCSGGTRGPLAPRRSCGASRQIGCGSGQLIRLESIRQEAQVLESARTGKMEVARLADIGERREAGKRYFCRSLVGRVFGRKCPMSESLLNADQ